jgi:hypothetical protein
VTTCGFLVVLALVTVLVFGAGFLVLAAGFFTADFLVAGLAAGFLVAIYSPSGLRTIFKNCSDETV